MITEHGVLPIALGDNWAYALPTSDGVILIAAGPDYDGAWDALAAQLDAAGLAIGDVRYVAITHAHIDHCGLAFRWQEAGVPVAASELEVQSFLHGSEHHWLSDAVRVRAHASGRRAGGADCGVHRVSGADAPGVSVGRQHGRRGARERWPGLIRGTPFRPDEPLADGAEIRLGDRRVVLVSAPGHTPGNCVFFEPETGALFSGDQVIPGLNSNPGWHWDISAEPPERFRSLPAFAESLDRLRRSTFGISIRGTASRRTRWRRRSSGCAGIIGSGRVSCWRCSARGRDRRMNC